jgi:hypothetical protein
VAWILWAFLASLPWLVPTHAQPWTAFHVDAAMIVPAALLLAYAVATGPSCFLIPRETWVLTAVAAVPIGQFLFGLIDYAGDAWLPTLYVLSLAAAIAVGSRLQQLEPWKLADALFASFALAGLVSVFLMVLQWLHVESLGTLLLSLPTGARLSANLGQPNQLATLLVWGLLAVWWAFLLHRLNGAVASSLAVLLLSGIAMTQSRTGALEIFLLACSAVHFRRQLRSSQYAATLVGLAVFFALAFVSWSTLNESLRPGQLPTLGERMAGGTRLQHWGLLLDAMVARPWFGWGWNQIVHAQWDFARLHPPTHEVVQYAHNLFLDLLLWNGIPIGLLLGMGIVAWFLHQGRHAVSPERVLLLLATAAFALHTLVEFPHGYFVFLLPVGLMVGSLHLPISGSAYVTLGRGSVTLVAAAILVLTTAILRDYAILTDAWMAQRLRAANIESGDEGPRPKLMVLSNMDALLVSLRSQPAPGMEAEELERLERITRRYPSPGALFRYAWALATNGRVVEATQTLAFLCKVHVEDQCVAAKRAWLTKAELEFPSAIHVWPTDRPRRKKAQTG